MLNSVLTIRLLKRRFNQAAELARDLSRATHKPFAPLALTRRRATRPQVGLSTAERRRNVQGAFAVPAASASQVKGYRVLLTPEGQLQWVTLENGQEVTFDVEPETGFWKRFSTGFMSVFVPESQL